jgi:phospholipid/cholesterol/gamma-HCH transport system permease protein
MARKLPSSLPGEFFRQLGEAGLLSARTFKNFFKIPWEKAILIQQLDEMGVRSLPVVSLTAAFGGLIFGLQTDIGFHRYIGPGSEAYGAPITSLSPASRRELYFGPGMTLR